MLLRLLVDHRQETLDAMLLACKHADVYDDAAATGGVSQAQMSLEIQRRLHSSWAKLDGTAFGLSLWL